MAGALKTLLSALQASSYLAGVSLVYGEEEIADQSQALPMVVMVPRGGPISSDGYEGAGDPAVERRWKVMEQVDLYLWAFSSVTNAQPIDHADATESLRQLVLSALQDQRAQYTDVVNTAYGLWFEVASQRWEQMQGAFTRYGRALVITVNCEITVDTAIGQEATINSFALSKTITAGPS